MDFGRARIGANFNPMIALLTFMAAVIVVATVCVDDCRAQDFNARSSPCNSVPGTSDLASCLDGALKTADALLNSTYRKTMHVLSREDQQRLLRVERVWLEYRDMSCTAERDLFGVGTAGPPAELACREAETRARIEALKRAYGWRVEKFGE